VIGIREEASVTATPVFDHIALSVPNLDEQVDRLHHDFDMVVQMRTEFFAVVVDPGSGLKFELSRSDDDDVHVRHLGFRVDDVDEAHADLVTAGMKSAQAPHPQDFAGMYTSYLQQAGGVEVQLLRYD
jgi:hypothetical protein